MSCKTIPKSESRNPPVMNAKNVKVFPPIPKSTAFAMPHTILPASIAGISER